MMYDKHLDTFSDEVVKVFYSKDRLMRYVVLKDEKVFLLINWKQSINTMKMNGNIYAHTTIRYPQCGILSEGLLENKQKAKSVDLVFFSYIHLVFSR